MASCWHQDPEQVGGLLVSLENALEKVESDGLDVLLRWKAGHLALPRLFELAAAANRLREKTNRIN